MARDESHCITKNKKKKKKKQKNKTNAYSTKNGKHLYKYTLNYFVCPAFAPV
jgi:hypothetical protein